MPSWVEAEIRNRLWQWLEIELEYNIYPEVNIGNGQIDLIARNSDGENIGFEVKGCPNPNPKILKQLRRYEKSNKLDKLYFVSNRVQFLEQLFEDKSGELFPIWKSGMFPELFDFDIPLDTPDQKKPAIQHIEEWVGDGWKLSSLAESVGIIQIPISLKRKDRMRVTLTNGCECIVNSCRFKKPKIVCEAEYLTRTGSIETPDREEQLQFLLWREYGGIPEGSLPHPSKGSGRDTLNIDLITFREAVNATESLESDGDTIGIEAKTKSGIKSDRVRQQLQNYIDSKCLTYLYLAVPKNAVGAARDVISDLGFKKSGNLGLLSLSKNKVSKIIEADNLAQKFDAYGSEDYPNHVGFGNAYIPEKQEPLSIKTT